MGGKVVLTLELPATIQQTYLEARLMSPMLITVALCLLVPALQLILGNVPALRVEPSLIADLLVYGATVIAVLATAGIVDWFPITFITTPLRAVVVLVILAVLPVLVGLCERWLRRDGESVYSGLASHWAFDHLKNNLLGALAGISIVLYLYSVQQEVVPYISGISWGAYMEPVLAFCALAAVWFVAVQQRAERPQVAAVGPILADSDASASPVASTLRRSTLRNPNQVFNVVWLTVIMAVCVRGGIYIVGVLHHMRVNQMPLDFSWWALPLLAGMLSFFFGCGTNPDKPEIYITFLAGTPVAILVEFVCLSLYQGGDGIGVARWAFPAACLALYALFVGLTFGHVEKGRVSMFSLVPTGLCIVAFVILMTVW